MGKKVSRAKTKSRCSQGSVVVAQFRVKLCRERRQCTIISAFLKDFQEVVDDHPWQKGRKTRAKSSEEEREKVGSERDSRQSFCS